MRLIIAGGGTGGHLFPGIAVAEEFLSRSRDNEVIFVGTERGIEARAVPAAGYRLELISAAGVRGKGFFTQIKAACMMLYGYAQSRKLLKSYKPDMVLGVGGYASLPMVLAARGMQVSSFIHEQNAVPGMTNKLLARVVDRVFITLDESLNYFPKEKTLLTGNPLRRQILALVNAAGSKRASERLEPVSNEPCQRLNLFVFGGSQGAHAINLAMADALPFLAACPVALDITHQTGEKDCAMIAAAYEKAGVPARVVAFIDDMAAEYARADVVICRAGATSIAEVTATGKACLFIPFPYAVDDHQRRNAEALVNKGAGFMLLEEDLNGEHLAHLILRLAEDPESVRHTGELAFSMARLDAAQIIVDEMISMAGQGSA